MNEVGKEDKNLSPLNMEMHHTKGSGTEARMEISTILPKNDKVSQTGKDPQDNIVNSIMGESNSNSNAEGTFGQNTSNANVTKTKEARTSLDGEKHKKLDSEATEGKDQVHWQRKLGKLHSVVTVLVSRPCRTEFIISKY